MAGWFFKGLASGVRTTAFPRRTEHAPGVLSGLPVDTEFETAEQALLTASRCPTGALAAKGRRVQVDVRLCIQCCRCLVGTPYPLHRSTGMPPVDATKPSVFERPLRHSIHILIVDAGDCGACLNEVHQLNSPQYNMHRLGFFVTPTPRNADLLLVVGQVTLAMREPLLDAYRAMPSPKRVMAVGSCAVSGLPFGPSFTAGAGASEVVPVDIEVPGSPPAPMAILQALLLLAGRASEIRGIAK